MKEEIRKIISALGGPSSGWERAIKEKKCGFSVEIPDSQEHGDYSTNVALILAKAVSKNPREVAEEIKSKISGNKLFEKVEVAGPGFINFFISSKVILEKIKKIDKNFGKNNLLNKKKVLIDYLSPNILKEFHIGHLMSNSIGESLSRIFEFEGAKVKRVSYFSDVGIGVAKAIYGILNNKKNFPKDSANILEKTKFLGQAYAFGVEKFETDENAKKEIIELNKKVFEKSDNEVNKFYEKGKKWSLIYLYGLYKKLGTKVDFSIPESEVSNLGKKIVLENLDKVFEKGTNGAIIFKGEQFGLHTRVFINSEGLPTYEAKDLALAEMKNKKYKNDISVVVTANEQNDYFKVMLSAMNRTNPKLAEKTKHIGHGMLRLPEGKMSSRTGKIITGESLILKVQEIVAEKIKDRALSEKEKIEISEKVAIGAIRYSILKQSTGSDIIYDFDKSVSFEGDSGPYLQYSYTRAISVLKKAKEEKIKPSFVNAPKEISQLEKKMINFPEAVLKAGKNYEPHFLAIYLTELASEFNNYYTKNKIVNKNDKNSSYRIALTSAFSQVMKNGMWLLGINTLEKM